MSKSGQNKHISPFFEEAHIVTDGQTDRQTNSLTPYTGVGGFFLSVKFASSLTRFARRWINGVDRHQISLEASRMLQILDLVSLAHLAS